MGGQNSRWHKRTALSYQSYSHTSMCYKTLKTVNGGWAKAGFSFLARPHSSFHTNVLFEKHPNMLPEREWNSNQAIPSSGLQALMLFSAHDFLLPSAQSALQSCQFYLVNPFYASCPLSHLTLSCDWHTLDAQISVPGVLEWSIYSEFSVQLHGTLPWIS